MAFRLLSHTAAIFAASIICVVGLSGIWSPRKYSGNSFTWLPVALVLWSSAAALEPGVVSQPVNILWSTIETVGLIQVLPLATAFAWRYTGQQNIRTRRNRAVLWVTAQVSPAFVGTTDQHLIWI